MTSLNNKIILITGAAQGIGEAASRVFSGLGATVILADIRKGQIKKNATAIRESGGEALALVLDVTDPNSVDLAVKNVVEQYGKLDGLFHNAMSAAYVNNNDTIVTELTDEVWNNIIQLALTGTFNVMRSVGREMLKNNSGSMVLTATVDAVIAQAGVDAYAAAKGGVIALARSAAAGLSPQGIRINSLCPSFVKTPDQAMFLEDPLQLKEFEKLHLIDIATPEDIAEFAAFLLSDSARCVTGANHMVDSGYSSFKGKLDLREQVKSE